LPAITGGVLELSASALGAHLGGLTGLSLGWFSAVCIEAAFMSPRVYRAVRSEDISSFVITEQSSVGVEPIWLIDTFIQLSTKEIYQEAKKDKCKKVRQQSGMSGGRPRLRPVRLQQFTSDDDHADLEAVREGLGRQLERMSLSRET